MKNYMAILELDLTDIALALYQSLIAVAFGRPGREMLLILPRYLHMAPLMRSTSVSG